MTPARKPGHEPLRGPALQVVRLGVGGNVLHLLSLSYGECPQGPLGCGAPHSPTFPPISLATPLWSSLLFLFLFLSKHIPMVLRFHPRPPCLLVYSLSLGALTHPPSDGHSQTTSPVHTSAGLLGFKLLHLYLTARPPSPRGAVSTHLTPPPHPSTPGTEVKAWRPSGHLPLLQ